MSVSTSSLKTIMAGVAGFVSLATGIDTDGKLDIVLKGKQQWMVEIQTTFYTQLTIFYTLQTFL
jgi:hypothetical protein